MAKISLLLTFFSLYANTLLSQWLTVPLKLSFVFAEANVVSFLDENNCVFYDLSNIYRTTNKGVTFERINSTFWDSDGEFLYQYSKNIIYSASSGRYTFAKTIDGGKNWQQIHLISPTGDTISMVDKMTPADMVFFDLNNGIVFSSSEYIFTTSDGGITWNEMPRKFMESVAFKARTLAKLKYNFVFGTKLMFADIFNQTKLIIADSLGFKWREIPIQPTYLIYRTIAMEDSLNGLAIALMLPLSLNQTKLCKTTDGGNSWDTIGKPPSSQILRYVRPSINKRGFYICGGSSGGKIQGSYISYNMGETWQRLDTLLHQSINFYNAEFGLSSSYQEKDSFPLRMYDVNYNGLYEPIKSSIKGNINIYPNPTNGLVMIDVPIIEYSLYTIQGRLLRKKSFDKLEKIQNIDLSEFEPGTYLIFLETDYKSTHAQRFIIQKD